MSGWELRRLTAVPERGSMSAEIEGADAARLERNARHTARFGSSSTTRSRGTFDVLRDSSGRKNSRASMGRTGSLGACAETRDCVAPQRTLRRPAKAIFRKALSLFMEDSLAREGMPAFAENYGTR
jgi:hypothetical protein